MQRTSKFLEFFKSLTFRLILCTMVVTIIPSVIVSTTILASYEDRALDIRQSEVTSQANILANQIATSQILSEKKVTSDTIKAQMDMLTTIYDGRILVVDNDFRIIYDTYAIDDGKTIISEEVIMSIGGETITKHDILIIKRL